jgi:predicted aspartyl protease
MVLTEDPFSHTYGGSSEFNAAAFLTSFDRKSFGRRIVAKINTNLNKPTISADRSWAYLYFVTSHKHCFLYDTGASVTLITPQTFEHAHQNGKVGKKWEQHGISIKNASGGAMEITGVYTIYFSIDGRQMEAPFIVTREATSNILGMNVIRTYKLKMDVLTTRVTASLAHVASLQTSEEYDVKVHKDLKVEAGMTHLTKLFLQDKKSGKRLLGRLQFMVRVGPLAVATVSDRDGVFELLIPNSTRYGVHYKRNDHMGSRLTTKLDTNCQIRSGELNRPRSSKGQMQHAEKRQSQWQATHRRRHGENQTHTEQQNKRSKHSLCGKTTVRRNVVQHDSSIQCRQNGPRENKHCGKLH